MDRLVLSDAAPWPSTTAGSALRVSVLVPVVERHDNLAAFYREYSGPLSAVGPVEFVFVTEPWAEREVLGLRALAEAGAPVRVLRVGQTVGEAALLKLGARECQAAIVLILSPQRRIVPEGTLALLEAVKGGADLAIARRWPRRDSSLNRAQTRIFHHLLRRLTGGRLHDIASGARAIRRAVLEAVTLYGDLARFLPILALRDGYRVTEVDVAQHPADDVTRVYSPGIYARRFLDLVTLVFLLRFTEKPLRFFGLLGAPLLVLGGGLLAVLAVQRLGGQPIANRPAVLLAVLLIVLGIQAIALGLIGEIIVHLNAQRRSPYRVRPEDLS